MEKTLRLLNREEIEAFKDEVALALDDYDARPNWSKLLAKMMRDTVSEDDDLVIVADMLDLLGSEADPEETGDMLNALIQIYYKAYKPEAD